MNEIHHKRGYQILRDVSDAFHGPIEGTSLCRDLKCYVISGLKYQGCITIVILYAHTRISVWLWQLWRKEVGELNVPFSTIERIFGCRYSTSPQLKARSNQVFPLEKDIIIRPIVKIQIFLLRVSSTTQFILIHGSLSSDRTLADMRLNETSIDYPSCLVLNLRDRSTRRLQNFHCFTRHPRIALKCSRIFVIRIVIVRMLSSLRLDLLQPWHITA